MTEAKLGLSSLTIKGNEISKLGTKKLWNKKQGICRHVDMEFKRGRGYIMTHKWSSN